MSGEISETYAKAHVDKSPLVRLFVEALLKTLGSRRNLRVLDVGGSDATMGMAITDDLHKDGHTIAGFHGVDRDADAIQRATARTATTGLYATEFTVGDIRVLTGIREASVDIVMVQRVFQHMIGRDIQETLGSIRRVIRPDGLLIVGGDPVWRDFAIEPQHPVTTIMREEILRHVLSPDLDPVMLRRRLDNAGFVINTLDTHPYPKLPWTVLRQFLRADTWLGNLIQNGWISRAEADDWLFAMEAAGNAGTLQATHTFNITVAHKQ